MSLSTSITLTETNDHAHVYLLWHLAVTDHVENQDGKLELFILSGKFYFMHDPHIPAVGFMSSQTKKPQQFQHSYPLLLICIIKIKRSPLSSQSVREGESRRKYPRLNVNQLFLHYLPWQGKAYVKPQTKQGAELNVTFYISSAFSCYQTFLCSDSCLSKHIMITFHSCLF